jgi:asparagine synthase (glutamine-hydrolysing)
VTVSLSGDGGDELFGGYNRYGSSLDEWARISRLPAAVRSGMALLGNPALRPVLSGLGQLISPLMASRRPSFDLADSIAYRASRLRHHDIDSFYRFEMSAWPETNYVIPESKEPTTLFDDTTLRERMPDPLDRMMIIDTLTYLPGAILEKVDRASMGVSLEARVPLLDHRLYDLAWRLPPDLRVRGGVTKWPLREVLARFVPRELFDRPKQGFGAPVASWLRGPLRGWAEALLEPKRIEREGVFSSVEVSRMWNSLLSERAPGGPIWNVLMFQAWLEARNGRVLIE